MRAKGILATALAAGVVLLASGIDAARADQSRGHRQNHQNAHQGYGHGYGWWGQQHLGGQRHGGHAYGKRARLYHDNHLTKHQRNKLRHLRHRFDNERTFRRYLRHHKPRLYGHYMAHNNLRHRQGFDHRRYRHANEHRRHRAQRYVWTRHSAY